MSIKICQACRRATPESMGADGTPAAVTYCTSCGGPLGVAVCSASAANGAGVHLNPPGSLRCRVCSSSAVIPAVPCWTLGKLPGFLCLVIGLLVLRYVTLCRVVHAAFAGACWMVGLSPDRARLLERAALTELIVGVVIYIALPSTGRARVDAVLKPLTKIMVKLVVAAVEFLIRKLRK